MKFCRIRDDFSEVLSDKVQEMYFYALDPATDTMRRKKYSISNLKIGDISLKNQTIFVSKAFSKKHRDADGWEEAAERAVRWAIWVSLIEKMSY